PFFGIDEIETTVLILIESDVVKNEKFGLGAEVRSIRDTTVSQVKLGLFRDPPGIPIVMLASNGIDDVSVHYQRAGFVKRIEKRGSRIRNDEHIALIDGRPTAYTRAVDAEPILERVLAQHVDRVTYVLGKSGKIREAEVYLFHFIRL